MAVVAVHGVGVQHEEARLQGVREELLGNALRSHRDPNRLRGGLHSQPATAAGQAGPPDPRV